MSAVSATTSIVSSLARARVRAYMRRFVFMRTPRTHLVVQALIADTIADTVWTHADTPALLTFFQIDPLIHSNARLTSWPRSHHLQARHHGPEVTPERLLCARVFAAR